MCGRHMLQYSNSIVHANSTFVKRRSQPVEEQRPEKPLEQVRDGILGWIKRTIYCNMRNPQETGCAEDNQVQRTGNVRRT